MPRRAWLLTLGAILLRAAAACSVAVIDSDGARDLRMAELIEEGRFTEALTVRAPTPPLHAFLSALVNIPIRNLLVAGVAVSVILGGLAVLPLFALTRRIWDERIATLSAGLYGLLPAVVDLQIEPMTEGTFLFLFLSAMAVGWSALEEQSWERSVAAAGLAALAWLTRPEGIYLLPLFAAAALLRFSRFAPVGLAVFLASWFLIAFPYLSFIRSQTGHWQASLSPIPGMIGDFLAGRRPAAASLQEYDEYRAVAKHGLLIGGALHLGSAFFGKVLFYLLGPFLILGFWRLRPAEGRRPALAWLLLAAGGYLVPVALSFAASTPFSHRFLLLPATLLLPVAALGLVRAAEWARWRHALPALMGVICVAMAVRDVRPRRLDKIPLKEAGVAILRSFGPGARIFSTSAAVHFYARSAYVPLPEDAGFETLMASRLKACAFTQSELQRWEPGLQDRVAARSDFLGEYPSPPRPDALTVRVYSPRP